MDFTMAVVFWLAPLVCIQSAMTTWAQTGQPRNLNKCTDARAKRLTQLLRALEQTTDKPASGEGLDRLYRILEELPLYGPLDEVACRMLLAARKKGGEGFLLALDFQRFWYAFAAGGAAGVPFLLQEIQAQDLPLTSFEHLVIQLGSIGPQGKEAIPSLRKMLADPRLDPRRKMAVRLALANMGDDSKENFEALVSSPGFPGEGPSILAPMRPAKGFHEVAKRLPRPGKGFETAARQLLPPEVVKEYGVVSEPPDYESYAMVWGKLGEEAAFAANQLHALHKDALAKRKLTAVRFGLAVARVDPDNRDRALRDLFRSLPRLFEHDWEFTRRPLITEDPYILVDAALANYLGGMLDDQDQLVAEGAAAVLEWAGLAARDAFPRVARYVRSDATSIKRAMAASVLGRITTFSQLSELEKLFKEEKAPEVRKELQAAIEGIRSLKMKPFSFFSRWLNHSSQFRDKR